MFEYSFWEIVSGFGSLEFWAGASLSCLLLFFAMPKRTRKYFVWFIFLILPSVLIAFGINSILKFIFQIPRPCFGDPNCPAGYSMPSGHAAVIFAAMTTLGLHYKKGKHLLFTLILAELVGISRIVLGVHTVQDVLIGSVIGILVGFLVQKAYEMYYKDLEKVVKKV